ncbi:Disease resistance protein RPP8 [Rhynchospora pubera]|uniref:Disease resistance protein RPP8 n=1 Tax=Rhynchospora pubera TaxID=906938 RepID=A0AAV8DRE1_9POAL|nr:Disease resistance protein RPP8 [Rhynchospora pubera]
MILVSRRSYDDSIMECGVHDLLRELAIVKAKDNKFLVVFSNNNVDSTFSDARRVSLQSWKLNENESHRSSNKLRSLFIFGDYLYDLSGFSNHSCFRRLKVLQVYKCSLRLQENKWFKELIQLRYLEFYDCIFADKEIPVELCHKQNLETLSCTISFMKLAESMWSIKTLRHVSSSLGQILPPPSDDLTFANLQTLGYVSLEHTQGESYRFPSLCELSLSKFDGSWDPITSLLRNKTLLKLVFLQMTGDDLPLDVVDMRCFVFFEHLQCLVLFGTWCHDVSLSAHFFPSCLTKLVLLLCNFTEDPMPELGKLQNLKILSLGFEVYIGSQMTCPAGGFPQLRKLGIWDQQGVEDLSIVEGTMSMLKNLKIRNLKLRRIPDLQRLTKLEEFVWNKAPFSEDEIQMMRHENQHKLEHIRSVINL